jgi:hypothetical protein
MIISRSNLLTSHDPVRWIISESKKGRNELGFIPHRAIQQYHDLGQILIAHENGDLLAYLASYTTNETHRIIALWTREDARREQAASKLLMILEQILDASYATCISLWCASDIEGLDFWKKKSFTQVGMREGSAKKKRLHIKMLKPIFSIGQPLLLPSEELLPRSLQDDCARHLPSTSQVSFVGRRALQAE